MSGQRPLNISGFWTIKSFKTQYDGTNLPYPG